MHHRRSDDPAPALPPPTGAPPPDAPVPPPLREKEKEEEDDGGGAGFGRRHMEIRIRSDLWRRCGDFGIQYQQYPCCYEEFKERKNETC